MKLYYSPAACSLAAHIVAREAGVAIELVRVDLGTHRLADGTDYYSINPRGYVPALQLEDGTLLTEVVAIVQYLGDLQPDSGLVPPAGTMARLHLQEWLTFISSEVHKVFSPWLWHKQTAESTRQQAKLRLALRFAELDRLLARQDYLLGAAFSVADAYAFTILSWSRVLGVSLQPYPALRAYLARVAARPKVVEALGAEGLLKKAA